MKKRFHKISLTLTNWMLFAAMAVGVLASRHAMAANGAIDYFTAVSPSGLGSPVYDMTNVASPYWNPTNENGGPVVFANTSQATFGTNAGDAHYPPGTSFSLLVDEASTVNGFVINSSNITLTLSGTENAHPTSANQVWWVTNGSTLIENDTWAGGYNFNSQTLTLAGGGTFTFQTTVGNNDNTNITENNAGGVVNLQAGNDTARSFGGGYILNSGTLNFAASAASTAFAGLTNSRDANGGFVINGGTIDNTSGSTMTLTIGSKGCTFGGNFTFTGSSSLNFGSASVNLTTNPVITVNANTLTLGGVVGGSGFGLTKLGSGTLTLSGTNTCSGSTLVGAGTLALTGSGSIAQSALIVSNSTLDLSGLTVPSANPSLSLSNATLVVSIAQNPITNETATTLNLGGTTNYVNVTSLPVITSYPSRFPLINYTTLNGTFNIGIGSLPSSPTPFGGYITNLNGLVSLVLTTGPAPARALFWTGTDGSNPNNWDVQTSLNWQTNGGPPTTYNQNDIITFSDSASGQTNIYLTTTLTPGILTVSNSVLVYNLGVGGTGGNGEISGATALTKQGTNLLILNDGGGNNFTGGLLISNGTVQVGLGDGHGSPGSGIIVDIGALVIDHGAVDGNLANDVSGTGTITQEGGDTLGLNGTNTFSGNIFVVSNSTLQVENANALNGFPVTTIANGSVLDLNSNTASGSVFAQGNGTGSGAIINSGSVPPSDIGLTNLTLTGNTTIGVTVNRFDLRSPGSTGGNPGTAFLSTGGQPYNLTKTGTGGTGVFGLVSATVDPFLANIDIQQGDFQMGGNTTGLGNPASTLTIESGATFELFAATNQVNKVFVFVDGGTILNSSGVNTIIGPMNITNAGNGGDCNFDINGSSLVLSNTLTGNGIIFTVNHTNTIFINGNSPAFAGGIDFNSPNNIVVNGVLNTALGVTIRSGLNGGQLTVNGQLLGGEVGPTFLGAIAGNGDLNVTVDSDGPIFPGSASAVGILTVSNLILDSSIVNFYVGPTTNSLIVVTNLTVNNNTININPTGLLQVGAKYTIFLYSGTLTQNSSFFVPGTGGYTYAVDTSTQGVVNIIPTGGPPVWNGGSVSDSDWSDSANWNGTMVQPGNYLYFGGTTRLNNTNDTTANNTYSNINFLANSGAFVISGQPFGLGSSISNNSANTQTFNLPLSFGSPLTVSPGPGAIIIGGGLTNTAPSPLTNYLVLTGTGIITNLLYSLNPTATNLIEISGSNANWTLLDNPSSTPMTVPWALEISNGVFNYGNAGSAPTLTSLTIHNVPSDSQLGQGSGANAALNFTNGSLTLNTLNTCGTINSTGTVNMAGGTLSLGPIGAVAADYFQGANGGNTGEVSVVNISGGLMNMGISNHITGPFYVASRGNGTLTMSGSGGLNCTTLDVSRNAQGSTFGSIGVVNLNGGTLTANRVGSATANFQTGPPSDGINPSAIFNFNGGTLRAGASSATFYQGSTTTPIIPITSIVRAGGAIIDSSNFAITVLEPLQHDSTLGATADGGLLKLGGGTLTLAVANNYTGPTVVSNGTLAVNGSIGTNTVTVETNGTLAGTGTVGGNVACNPGGNVAPAGVGAIGTLTVNGNVTLGGAEMDLNATTLTNDVLTSSGTITYGGTLTVTNLSGTPVIGQVYTLFQASTLSGSFTATNLPAYLGLAWNWNPANGTLTVIQGNTAPLIITSFSLSGQNVLISATNSQAGINYYLLTTTNLITPLNQWVPVFTNLATANSFSSVETSAVLPGDNQQYYILSSTNF